jgi:hypothetical protein
MVSSRAAARAALDRGAIKMAPLAGAPSQALSFCARYRRRPVQPAPERFGAVVDARPRPWLVSRDA